MFLSPCPHLLNTAGVERAESQKRRGTLPTGDETRREGGGPRRRLIRPFGRGRLSWTQDTIGAKAEARQRGRDRRKPSLVNLFGKYPHTSGIPKYRDRAAAGGSMVNNPFVVSNCHRFLLVEVNRRLSPDQDNGAIIFKLTDKSLPSSWFDIPLWHRLQRPPAKGTVSKNNGDG
jgi:hypothetical protein